MPRLTIFERIRIVNILNELPHSTKNVYIITSQNVANKYLQVFFLPKLRRTTDYRKYHFQQNGTAPYTANMVQEWL